MKTRLKTSEGQIGKKKHRKIFFLCVFFSLPFCRNFWSRPRCQDILAQNQSVSGTYGPKYGPHVEFWCGCPWAVHSSLPDLDHELALITVRLPKVVIYVNIQNILPEKGPQLSNNNWTTSVLRHCQIWSTPGHSRDWWNLLWLIMSNRARHQSII